MPQSANIYGQMLPQALGGHINLLSDTIRMILLGSGYTPNFATDTYYSNVSAQELPTAGGYTVGGVTLASKTLNLTAANSWGVVWAASTAYGYGQVVTPTVGNGNLYRCVQAGTTGGSAPVWPTVSGLTVTDGTVIWACAGGDILVFSSASVSWTAATFSAYYAALYDAQTGVTTTEPLIALQNFGGAQSPASQTYQVLPDPQLGWFYFSPPA